MPSPPPFMFGDWKAGDPHLDNKAIQEKEPESKTSGGTSHLLPLERLKTSFDVLKLTHVIDGDEKMTSRRRWIWGEGDEFDNSGNYYRDREQVVSDHVERFIKLHKKFADQGFVPSPGDVMMMTIASKNGGAFGLHYGAFCPTLLSQCTDEQKMEWLLPAAQMKIVGALAQTELGHGSNVRALQTTATYDRTTQEFILNTPTLKAMKWWPGGLGKTATHCACYAQLIIDGVEYGLHTFILQIRDENHKPLPGIELGEIGPKVGDNHTETGYMRLDSVRIPRTWMMMKNQQVTPEGQYVKSEKLKTGAKLMYSTMLAIRASLVMGAGYKLAQAVTVAVRYSCVRHQGFVAPESASDRTELENVVLEYQTQQYRILKQLALAYAMIFTGKSLSSKFRMMKEGINSSSEEILRDLPEMHATSAGLKALCTFEAASGIEDCRKCCGGHGVLLSSGLSQLSLDYVTYCTAEGDRIILELQAARFLVKSYNRAQRGEAVARTCDYMAEEEPKNKISQFDDPLTLMSLFRQRALICVSAAAERLASGETVNDCALDLVRASRSHCHYVILRGFVDQIEQMPNKGGVVPIMRTVCCLYGVTHIEENLGDWVGLLDQKAITILRKTIRRLLAVVRNDAVGLTDAFEFSDNVLNSALGRHDGKVYESLYEAARASPLNHHDPFIGYEEYLRPSLDLEFLKEHAAMVRQSPPSARL